MLDDFQKNTWLNSFGKEYTDRNIYSPYELDEFYFNQYGVSRSEMNHFFLSEMKDKKIRILEVGSNVGNQLRSLQRMGYDNLYGIELQPYAVQRSKSLTKGINIIQASAEDIPFKNDYFNIVFTSGVLIHISPKKINKVISEIYRCSRKYVWGFEYYADNYTEVNYRENKDLLWKNNFAKLYIERYKDLKLIKEKKYKYLKNDNVDHMFLLQK